MKKFLTMFLVLAMVLSLGVSAFAASPIESVSENNTDSKEVTVTVTDLTPAATVYHVVVTWGNLEFTYSEGTQGTWNPETHSYDNAVEASWTKNSAGVTVTNHSNAAVNISAAAVETDKEAAEGAKDGVTVTLTDNAGGDYVLATAEGLDVDNADSITYTVTASGTPNENLNADGTVATITVTISEPTA